MTKIFVTLLLICALTVSVRSQWGLWEMTEEITESGSSSGNKLSLGIGVTSAGMPAGSIAFKLRSFENFYFGTAIDVVGANVNNGAHNVGLLLLSVVPEYKFLSITDRLSMNTSAGFGFIFSMEPVFCITPGLGLEVKISRSMALELDSKYMITKNKNGRDINGIIVTKLNLNFLL
jgi:hypothetical protein